MLIIVFMAVTSAGSSEFMAVGSLFTFDIYKVWPLYSCGKATHSRPNSMTAPQCWCKRPAYAAICNADLRPSSQHRCHEFPCRHVYKSGKLPCTDLVMLGCPVKSQRPGSVHKTAEVFLCCVPI